VLAVLGVTWFGEAIDAKRVQGILSLVAFTETKRG